MRIHPTYIIPIMLLVACGGNSALELTPSTPTTTIMERNRMGISQQADLSVEGTTRAQTTLGQYEENGHTWSLASSVWDDNAPHTRVSWNDGLSWGKDSTSLVGVFAMLHRSDDELAGKTAEELTTLFGTDRLKDPSGNIIIMNKRCTAFTASDSRPYLRYVNTANPYVRSTDGVCDGVDFYAYYPYCESSEQLSSQGGNSLDNAAKTVAIILHDTLASNIAQLHFALKTTQTDSNIWFNDLMYSKREDANTDNVYGNIGKKNLGVSTPQASADCDNVHLHMQHALCRLRINIEVDSIFLKSQLVKGAAYIPVSLLWIDGEKIHKGGQLNLVTGEITTTSGGDINRILDSSNPDHHLSFASPYIKTDILFVPTQIDRPGQMVLNVTIGGSDYSCDLYYCRPATSSNITFENGHIYDLKLDISTNTSVVVEQYHGGVTICTKANPCNEELTAGDFSEWIANERSVTYHASEYNYMILQPYSDWTIGRITCNSDNITEQSSQNDMFVGTVNRNGIECPVYKIKSREYAKTIYRIVFIPKTWYAAPSNILQHYDGYYNTGFSSIGRTQPDKYWNELMGTGEAASLAIQKNTGQVNDFSEPVDQSSSKPYSSITQSGWTYGGFKCNGNTDYVAFPALLKGKEFTIDIYLCIEAPQTAYFPRIMGEADPGYVHSNTTINTMGYPSIVMDTPRGTSFNNTEYSTSRKAHVMGLGLNSGDLGNEISLRTDGKTLLHIVVRYRGGNGTLNALTGARGCDPRNVMALSVEFFNNSQRSSQMICYSGSSALNNEIMNEGVWGAKHAYTSTWSLDAALAFLRNVESNNVVFPYTYDYNDDGSVRQQSVTRNNYIQTTQLHYLEDAYLPKFGWATMCGRQDDYSRNLNATICSFMVYDRFLSYEQVEQNFNMHLSRFGAVKSDLKTKSE